MKHSIKDNEPPVLWIRLFRSRQEYPKRTAFDQPGLGVQRALVGLDNMLDQGQPQPRASALTYPPIGGTEKPLRKMGPVLRSQADAPVMNGDQHAMTPPPGVPSHLHFDVSFLFGIFDGVADQVEHSLRNGVAVRKNRWQILFH